ncbi:MULTISPECIES: NAD(P)/FAD-dependent oxidoreductase [unclassified Pseudomonas]|uniref:FAD-dependent oxidoreductase n=1 Tax=unclassified Pseudomonas TaxID=196821 RepID=UPI0015A2B6CD|nr:MULTISPECIES: NAD(P)/FAD-dependent oxidoreductase [unclassified Pseudomonas]NWC94852.1 FAD-dependent monooxygenase [Pseudomonas sp. IPO3779]NWD15924.1 FAD-dependent monooxygenase [Pseudomonas sp. IPO3778]
MNRSLRVAIVGGGPAGLTLARILEINGFAVNVFERERGPLERPQGGTLDLHAESGQLALKRAGLEHAFRRIARYEDQGSRLMDKHAHLLLEDPDPSAGDRPEVDRTALRQILLDSLSPDCVTWDVNITGVHPADDARWTLHQGDTRHGPFDLIVGADGAWSKVRPLLSRYQPQYSGLTFIEFGIDEVDRRHPAIARLVGRGKLDVSGDARALVVQRNANAHLRGYAIFRVPIEWAEHQFDWSSPEATRHSLLAQFEGWHPDILALLHAANDRFLSRGIYALPVGHHWAHRPGLTLIGDAAHLMSPFGGEGVNAAMLDGAELARHLIENTSCSEAVHAYEAEMFERIEPIARDSAEAAATQLSHDDIALSLAHFRSHQGEHDGLTPQ